LLLRRRARLVTLRDRWAPNSGTFTPQWRSKAASAFLKTTFILSQGFEFRVQDQDELFDPVCERYEAEFIEPKSYLGAETFITNETFLWFGLLFNYSTATLGVNMSVLDLKTSMNNIGDLGINRYSTVY